MIKHKLKTDVYFFYNVLNIMFGSRYQKLISVDNECDVMLFGRIQSTKLNMFKLNDLSDNLLQWRISDIKKKIILFNFNNQLIAIPILHT